MWWALAAQDGQATVHGATPERAGQRTAAPIELNSHFKTIIVIVFIVAEQAGEFIPNASPGRQIARETKSLGETG
ncbi:hypothetical protein ccbrp13_63400 [Ktedonobacteria bacterium brp13]|nr:hypothetical protein ccbrp13_63400 [Ktedonobacteria bacterium brp13]